MPDIATAWPTLGLEGFDFLGLQEVGGLGELDKSWDTVHAEFDNEPWAFYATNPPLTWRAVLLGMPSHCTTDVERVIPLDVGICVVLKLAGYRQFLISAHLPHRQREDCLQCWQGFIAQLEDILKCRRFQDTLVLALDANYELGSARHGESTGRVDEREVYSHLLLRNFGLTHTRVSYTWSNTRGASSKIDYILLSSPTNELKDQWILTDSDVLLGSDHRAVAATF